MRRKGTCNVVKELTLEMSDGFSVYAFVKRPEVKPIGHIHIFHGMAEHIGRYETTIQFFVEQGYIVSGHDHRGHGKSAELNGLKGHFADKNGFNRVVEDASEIITHVRSTDPALKFILIGHSMGSFVARRYIQLYGNSVDLVILSGTGDDGGIARYAGQTIGYLAGKKDGFTERNDLLDSLVFGGFNKTVKSPETKFDWLSRDSNLVLSYVKDEHCGFIPTTRFFLDLFDGLGLIHKKSEIALIPKELPILLFAGTEDPVGNNGKSLWKVASQYEDAHIEDVTVLLFESGRHELLNDSTRKEVIQTVHRWIEQH